MATQSAAVQAAVQLTVAKLRAAVPRSADPNERSANYLAHLVDELAEGLAVEAPRAARLGRKRLGGQQAEGFATDLGTIFYPEEAIIGLETYGEYREYPTMFLQKKRMFAIVGLAKSLGRK